MHRGKPSGAAALLGWAPGALAPRATTVWQHVVPSSGCPPVCRRACAIPTAAAPPAVATPAPAAPSPLRARAAAVLLRCCATQPRLAAKLAATFGLTERDLSAAQRAQALDAISALLDAAATSASGVALLLHFPGLRRHFHIEAVVEDLVLSSQDQVALRLARELGSREVQVGAAAGWVVGAPVFVCVCVFHMVEACMLGWPTGWQEGVAEQPPPVERPPACLHPASRQPLLPPCPHARPPARLPACLPARRCCWWTAACSTGSCVWPTAR